ncbi:hypothetical protein [Aquabacterium sp.]|uniref:hypothetical protein n=1 Tax=Aquabacterium sp. TaxID=1872578 RepID=UPI0037845C95
MSIYLTHECQSIGNDRRIAFWYSRVRQAPGTGSSRCASIARAFASADDGAFGMHRDAHVDGIDMRTGMPSRKKRDIRHSPGVPDIGTLLAARLSSAEGTGEMD